MRKLDKATLATHVNLLVHCMRMQSLCFQGKWARHQLMLTLRHLFFSHSLTRNRDHGGEGGCGLSPHASPRRCVRLPHQYGFEFRELVSG